MLCTAFFAHGLVFKHQQQCSAQQCRVDDGGKAIQQKISGAFRNSSMKTKVRLGRQIAIAQGVSHHLDRRAHLVKIGG